MTKIVAEQFQLDRIPQSLPRTAKDPIYELIPKLTKHSLYPLPHAAVKLSLLSHIPARYQQKFRFIGKKLGESGAFIPQISKQYSSLDCLRQIMCGAAIIEFARSQNSINNTTTDVAQDMQFEAEEPARAGLAKVCSLFTKQAHPSVSNGLADWYGLGINQVELTATCNASSFKEAANEMAKTVQAVDPLLIRRQQREGTTEVILNEFVGLLERINSEAALHQSDGDDFGVSECGSGIRRISPTSPMDMCFEEVINEAVDFGHLIYNRSQMGRPPGVEMSLVTSFYTPSGL